MYTDIKGIGTKKNFLHQSNQKFCLCHVGIREQFAIVDVVAPPYSGS
jgi:hypothetical protein